MHSASGPTQQQIAACSSLPLRRGSLLYILYFLRLLRRAGVQSSHIVRIFTTHIRSLLEYTCPAWHTGLPGTPAEKLEGVQRRALGIAYPDSSSVTEKRCSCRGCPHCTTLAKNHAAASFRPYFPPCTNSTICCLRRERSAMNCVDRPTMTPWANMTVSGVLSSLTD